MEIVEIFVRRGCRLSEDKHEKILNDLISDGYSELYNFLRRLNPQEKSSA